ncbi:hypothetical protein GCM10023336_61350 [Streptomyces similanensis]|uniref:Uncharacterized protein n=1 Tax=Streptomyces similanensis TaxID=1274988 RepID=A0ABP9LDB4_9ACTN
MAISLLAAVVRYAPGRVIARARFWTRTRTPPAQPPLTTGIGGAAPLGTSSARRAEQAREGGRPGQSQQLRDVPEPPVEEEPDR